MTAVRIRELDCIALEAYLEKATGKPTPQGQPFLPLMKQTIQLLHDNSPLLDRDPIAFVWKPDAHLVGAPAVLEFVLYMPFITDILLTKQSVFLDRPTKHQLTVGEKAADLFSRERPFLLGEHYEGLPMTYWGNLRAGNMIRDRLIEANNSIYHRTYQSHSQ